MPLGRHYKVGTMFGGHRLLKIWEGIDVQNLVYLGKLSNLNASISGTDEDVNKL